MESNGFWSSIKEDFFELTGTFCCCLIESKYFLRCMPILFIGIQFLTLILQLIATFETHWIYTADCNNMGLKSSCVIPHTNSSENVTELSTVSVFKIENGDDLFGLQITSCSMNLLCLVMAVLVFCRLRGVGESKSSIQTSCFTCVLPLICIVSGFLNFVGCMVLTGTGYQLGYSFYLCLSSAVILMTFSIMSVTGYCCLKLTCCY